MTVGSSFNDVQDERMFAIPAPGDTKHSITLFVTFAPYFADYSRTNRGKS